MMSPKDDAKRSAPKDSMSLLPCFYFVELPIVAASMASLYILELTDVLQPAWAGFHCHDRALSMPYTGATEEPITLLLLLSLAFSGPAIAILLGEAVLYCLQSRLKIRLSAERSINAGGCRFNSFLRRTVRFVGVQLFGLLATALVTDLIQLATGCHAPFFLTVCQPNYTAPGVSCERNSYITRDICAGPDQPAILAARKSFPSQHATLSAFAAVYVSMYFNSCISDSTKLLKPLLVFGFCMAACLTGLIQITQHHSHPADVYGGFLIGAAIAAYLALFSVGNFKSCEESPPGPTHTLPSPPRALAQRGHESVYHKGGASESSEELGAGPRHGGAEPRSRQARRERASLGGLKRASADVELLAPRSPMGKETMVTFSNTLPRANCPGLAPPEEPARRPLTFLAPPDEPAAACEWKQRSLELWGAGPERDAGERDEGRPEEAGGRAATPSPLYPAAQAGWGCPGAMATVATPPWASSTAALRPVVPPLVHIPEEASAPPPVSPKSATTRAKWLSMTEQGGAPGGGAPGGGAAAPGGATGGAAPVGVGAAALPGAPGIGPGPLRPPGQPRVAQVIAMSKHLSPRSSETLSSSCASSRASSCASSTSSSEAACCHAPPERGPSGIVTVNAHAPHHPVVRLPPPPANSAPWGWSSVEARQLRSPNSLVPAASVSEPACEPRPDPPPVGHARPATPLHPAASFERAGSIERGGTLERMRSTERGVTLARAGSTERGVTLARAGSTEKGVTLERAGSSERGGTLERAGSLQQKSANQL